MSYARMTFENSTVYTQVVVEVRARKAQL